MNKIPEELVEKPFELEGEFVRINANVSTLSGYMLATGDDLFWFAQVVKVSKDRILVSRCFFGKRVQAQLRFSEIKDAIEKKLHHSNICHDTIS